MLTLAEVKKAEILQTIVFPLIVPSKKEVLSSNELDLSNSDLNACYSKNKKNGKAQSWYDVQLTVKDHNNLPSREDWFYIVTDDGYLFKACFTGKKVKKLSSLENRRIIGGWIKGMLADLELISGFEYVHQDPNRIGIITKEILQIYGGDQIFLKKTNKTKKDKNGIERDVWFLSFPFSL